MVLECLCFQLTTTLHEKREDIAGHKDLGQPLCSNDGVLVSVQEHDQPSEDHVDGRGVERRADEDENGPRDVGTERPVRGLGCVDASCDISDCFHCGSTLSVNKPVKLGLLSVYCRVHVRGGFWKHQKHQDSGEDRSLLQAILLM